MNTDTSTSQDVIGDSLMFGSRPKLPEGREVTIPVLVDGRSEVLKTPTKEFDFDDPPMDPIQLSYDMVASLLHHGGVGLSANQIGLPYRVFAMKAAVPFVCFNPKIVFFSEETIKLEEGCLSFPGVFATINRPKHIRCRFQTPSGIYVTKTFTGLTARVFQHEMEHLDGGFFFDGIGRMRMEKALKTARKAGFDYSQYNLLKRAVGD